MEDVHTGDLGYFLPLADLPQTYWAGFPFTSSQLDRQPFLVGPDVGLLVEVDVGVAQQQIKGVVEERVVGVLC